MNGVSLEEITDVDTKISTKVYLKNDYHILLLEYYDEQMTQQPKKRVIKEIRQILTEKSLHNDLTDYDLLFNPINENFSLKLKSTIAVERAFFISQKITSSANIWVDMAKEKIDMNIFDISITYYVSDQQVGTLKLEDFSIEKNFSSFEEGGNAHCLINRLKIWLEKESFLNLMIN